MHLSAIFRGGNRDAPLSGGSSPSHRSYFPHNSFGIPKSPSKGTSGVSSEVSSPAITSSCKRWWELLSRRTRRSQASEPLSERSYPPYPGVDFASLVQSDRRSDDSDRLRPCSLNGPASQAPTGEILYEDNPHRRFQDIPKQRDISTTNAFSENLYTSYSANEESLVAAGQSLEADADLSRHKKTTTGDGALFDPGYDERLALEELFSDLSGDLEVQGAGAEDEDEKLSSTGSLLNCQESLVIPNFLLGTVEPTHPVPGGYRPSSPQSKPAAGTSYRSSIVSDGVLSQSPSSLCSGNTAKATRVRNTTSSATSGPSPADFAMSARLQEIDELYRAIEAMTIEKDECTRLRDLKIGEDYLKVECVEEAR